MRGPLKEERREEELFSALSCVTPVIPNLMKGTLIGQ